MKRVAQKQRRLSFFIVFSIYIYWTVNSPSGTDKFFTKHRDLCNLTGGASEDHEPVCKKDTGAKQKSLQKWSRGLLHFVHGGGHIESWSPLFV